MGVGVGISVGVGGIMAVGVLVGKAGLNTLSRLQPKVESRSINQMKISIFLFILSDYNAGRWACQYAFLWDILPTQCLTDYWRSV